MCVCVCVKIALLKHNARVMICCLFVVVVRGGVIPQRYVPTTRPVFCETSFC